MCMETPSVPTADSITGPVLRNQIKKAPKVLAANQKFSPEYNRLQLSNLSEFLTGSRAATGGVAGIYSSMMPQFTAAADQAASTTRNSTAADAMRLAPQYREMLRTNNPQAASLLDSVSETAQTGMDAGSRLTADQQRTLDASLRSSAGVRGMNYGPAAAFSEAMANGQYGDSLLQQRMSNASEAAGALQNFYGDPYSRVLATNANGTGAGLSLAGLAAGNMAPAQMSSFNPESAYAIMTANNKYDSSKTTSTEKAASMQSL